MGVVAMDTGLDFDEKMARIGDLIDGKIASDMDELVQSQYKLHKARELAKEKYTAEKTGTSGTLRIVRDSEILARPAPEWWVEGLFQKSTVGILAGQGGIGKSFLMLHFARCIASGKNTFGKEVQQGNVLYVAAEGATAFGKRARAWDDYFKRTVEEKRLGYLEEGVNLSSPESVAALKGIMIADEIDFLILDTFSQLSAVDSENDAAQIAAILKTAKEIRDCRPGSTVILVHHVNKAGGQVRGSSAFRDNVDTLITAKGDESGFYLSTLASDYAKQKDGEGEKLGTFKLHTHLDSKVVIYEPGTSAPDTAWAAVRAAMDAASTPLSTTDMESASGLQHTAFSNRLSRWKRDAIIEEVKVEGSKAKHYRLTLLPS